MARTRPGLTRDAVLTAALGIIDESGLEGCTMRAVAAELGVEAMSLYWHVRGKEALLDGVVERMLGEVAAEHRDEHPDWRRLLEDFGHAYHRVLLRHPNAIHLISGRSVGAYIAASKMAETGLTTLEDGGFDRASAIRAVRTVTRFVLGFALLEVSTSAPQPLALSDAPALGDIVDAVLSDDQEELFRFGLDALIDGFEAKLRRA